MIQIPKLPVNSESRARIGTVPIVIVDGMEFAPRCNSLDSRTLAQVEAIHVVSVSVNEQSTTPGALAGGCALFLCTWLSLLQLFLEVFQGNL